LGISWSGLKYPFLGIYNCNYGRISQANGRMNGILRKLWMRSTHFVREEEMLRYPDRAVLQEFGRMKHALETQGIPLADADLFIAATCIKKCTKLITGNMKYYERIPGLKIENWLR
jgi:predicted nucleic acid-binding protein